MNESETDLMTVVCFEVALRLTVGTPRDKRLPMKGDRTNCGRPQVRLPTPQVVELDNDAILRTQNAEVKREMWICV